jgi:malonyl CoA-acyl carrier protein transacylase
MQLEQGHHVVISGTPEAIDVAWQILREQWEEPRISRASLRPEGGPPLEAFQTVDGAWHIASPSGLWSA